jgi:hypothetical protein
MSADSPHAPLRALAASPRTGPMPEQDRRPGVPSGSLVIGGRRKSSSHWTRWRSPARLPRPPGMTTPVSMAPPFPSRMGFPPCHEGHRRVGGSFAYNARPPCRLLTSSLGQSKPQRCCPPPLKTPNHVPRPDQLSKSQSRTWSPPPIQSWPRAIAPVCNHVIVMILFLDYDHNKSKRFSIYSPLSDYPGSF